MGHVYVVLNGSVVIHRALQENALATDPGARGGFGWCFFGLFQTVGSLRDVPSLPETNSKFAPENMPFAPKGKDRIPTIHKF